MRNIEFANDEYYHIYNRGVDHRDIFLDDSDNVRFLRSMRIFNNDSTYEERDFILRKMCESKPKLVEFICYCLNPNHYHFIARQLVESGISKFMQKLNLGYTHYFNKNMTVSVRCLRVLLKQTT